MDQREEVSEDTKSPTHFFGTICSAGVASDETSKLPYLALVFFSDMPGLYALTAWTIIQYCADIWERKVEIREFFSRLILE